LAVMLNDRRVAVREAPIFSPSAIATYVPGGLTLLSQFSPKIKRHAFTGIVDEFGKKFGIVNGRGPE